MIHDLIQKYSNLTHYATDRGENTSELFTPNDFYGHAKLIKKYCGIKNEIPLPGIIPHGYGLNQSRPPWNLELGCQLIKFYLWSEEKKEYYQRFTHKEIIVVGSPH